MLGGRRSDEKATCSVEQSAGDLRDPRDRRTQLVDLVALLSATGHPVVGDASLATRRVMVQANDSRDSQNRG